MSSLASLIVYKLESLVSQVISYPEYFSYTKEQFFPFVDKYGQFKFKDWNNRQDAVYMKILREVPGDGLADTACVCIYSSVNGRMGRMEYPADSVKIVECSWQIRYNEDKQCSEEESGNKTVEDVFRSFLNDSDEGEIEMIKEIIK